VIDVANVTAAVEEMAQVLRADGGDLVLVGADPATDRIEVRVELEGVECLDCVMPPKALLVLVDPRA
jgi:Fe-S cluster biogenesis protein NfuA